MTTLPSDQIIPAGVARRLAHTYQGIDLAEAATGRNPACEQATLALGPNGSGKLDSRAAMADCAALADYLATHGSIDPDAPLGEPGVVPWSYRRLTDRACAYCGGSGIRCCELARDR